MVDVLFGDFALFVADFAERNFLDQRTGAGEGFDMLTWHFNFDHVNHSFTESVAQNKFDLDGAGNSEDMDLEHFLDLEVQVGPVTI